MLKSDEDEEERISVNRFHQSYPLLLVPSPAWGPAATAGIYLTIANLQVSRCLQVPGRLDLGAWSSIETAQYRDNYVNLQAPVRRAPGIDMLSDISSDILSGVSSDISSHTPSNMSSDILSDIF